MLASLRRAASSSSLQPSRSLSVRGIQTWALRRPPSRLAHRLGDRHSVQPQPSAVKRPFHSTTPTRAAISPGGFQFDPRRPLDRTQWNGRTYLLVGGGIAATAYYVVHLEQVPATGRWRFMDVSPSRERRLAEDARAELLKTYGDQVLPANHPLTQHIRGIVERLLTANDLGVLVGGEDSALGKHPSDSASTSTQTLTLPASDDRQPTESSAEETTWDPDRARNWSGDTASGNEGGKPSRLGKVANVENGQTREWTLMVVNDPNMVNAAAAFGNIIVFTGILPVAQTETGLASVIAHEIGHVVARHSTERASSQKVVLALTALLDFLGITGLSEAITTLLFVLPNSRTQELEADTIGLRISAKACYDPAETPEMFKRMSALEKVSGGSMLPKFLRTHPVTDQRVQSLTAELAQAYQLQESSSCAAVQEAMQQFGQMRYQFSKPKGRRRS